MFDALARLADGRGKLVVVLAIAFFAVAGAIGSGVASKLDPYGADDPATETYKAAEQLRDAGHRDTSVVVLVDGPVAAAETKRQVSEIETELRANPDVASVVGFADTRSRDFVARDGGAQYLAVALKPTDDKRWQAAADEIADELAGQPGIKVGGPAL
jgi:predicted RND superfamily exporter protein